MILSISLACFAALWSVQKVSLHPLELSPRSLEMATASTHVVVDTPISSLVDLRQDTYSFEALKNRAILLGNVIGSSTVRQRVADAAGVPVDRLRVQAPLTSEQLAPPVDSENARHTNDILKSTDQYRLNIQANPSVPMLDIYAQTPDARSAAKIVNAAVDELQRYLRDLAVTEETPLKSQIHLIQLGRARGTVINQGVNRQMALLVFLLAFGVCSATVIYVNRVRTGWRLAALADAGAPG